MKAVVDPRTGRLTVATVERMHALLGGDQRTEEMITEFIGERYGAKSLLELPVRVASQVLRRPTDFIGAAKRFCEPELPF